MNQFSTHSLIIVPILVEICTIRESTDLRAMVFELEQ